MWIGIDAHTVGMGVTGNETYVTNLVKTLAQIDSENNYLLYLSPLAQKVSFLPKQKNFHQVVLKTTNRWSRLSIAMPMALWKQPIDLLHVQYVTPLFVPCPYVVTIHDISYIHVPHQLRAHTRWLLNQLFPFVARRAVRVITGSNQTKTDLIKYFGLNADKVVVTPYGVDPCFRPITDKQRFVEVKTKYGIDNEFILYVGNLQPRKNLVRLFLAFERLKIKRKINEKLVIVGKKAWLYQDIFKTYEQLKAKEEIIFTGYVPTEEIPVLYSAARIFVYPSLYEGFGLPPLEAMACGVPVLTSLVSSLPEVVGDSALLVDPYSVEEIANGIERLLSDEKLRLSLREKGLRKASTFSWRRTAELTLAVYRDALREVKSEYVS